MQLFAQSGSRHAVKRTLHKALVYSIADCDDVIEGMHKDARCKHDGIYMQFLTIILVL